MKSENLVQFILLVIVATLFFIFIAFEKQEERITNLKTEVEHLQQQNDSLTQRFETLHKDVAKFVIMESENRRQLKAREIFNKSY